MKNYGFLFWAYNVIWAGIAFWIFTIFTRVGRIDRRLDGMERELERHEAAQKSSDS